MDTNLNSYLYNYNIFIPEGLNNDETKKISKSRYIPNILRIYNWTQKYLQ